MSVLLTGSLLFVPAMTVSGSTLSEPAPSGLTMTSPQEPLSDAPLLSWNKNFDAIAYEIEIFSDNIKNLDPLDNDSRAIYRTTAIYTNFYELPLYEISDKLPKNGPVYWRVRALKLGRQAISPFSELVPLYTDASLPHMNAPIPRKTSPMAKGAAMLYPVYGWIRPTNASYFEVQIFAEDPDKNSLARPISVYTAPIAELYDTEPRMGDTTYYWRVRSLGEDGKPLGDWSKVSGFRTSPSDHWKIAVFGDSISHGGGRLSFGPEELEYSWLHYLDSNAVNLSQSGNLTSDMLARFERDVVPFHPEYLIIMGGTNDLRSDEYTLESTIKNMNAIEEKCRRYGIKPIFLTLPPINPANIIRAFDEQTDPEWKNKFARFNDFLRTKPHIDVAKSFAAYSSETGELPEWLGYDGLHEDVIGKQLIAARVNAEWETAVQAADEWFKQ